jgi:hypothetical protein
MAVIPCNFTITPSANGGRLSGNGFNGRPRMNSGDTLQVIVRWAGGGAPTTLTGHFIFSPDPHVQGQATPSPFLNGSKYVCYQMQTANADGSGISFTFPPLTYAGGQPGKYELTFVAQDGATPPTQWSEDPEFDTGS